MSNILLSKICDQQKNTYQKKKANVNRYVFTAL